MIVYKALLISAGSGITYNRLIQILGQIINECLSFIFKIDFVTNVEVLVVA